MTFEKPLVLIPDTPIQRTPLFQSKRYPAPCTVSDEVSENLASVVEMLAIRARFNYIKRPAYQVYNNNMFRGHRRKFWKPVLKHKFPIYIVSPMLGVIWPGNYIGTYTLSIEESFFIWRRYQLWRYVVEVFENNGCDCVLSFLPRIYDNIVHAEEVPWFVFEPDDFVKNQRSLLKSTYNMAKPRKLSKNKKDK